MKSQLRANRGALESLWQQGLSGQALLRGQSKLVEEFGEECFLEAGVQGADESVALVALGGYGRQELFPYSDIDLMILYRPEVKGSVAQVADSILYPLWDTGLEVGHGVRSVEEAVGLAAEDFFFRVAMLDARLIAGSQLLYFELLSTYKAEFVEGKRQEFVEIMEGVRAERRMKFGKHSYLLEPQVKEGKGGLRDVQAMLWTAKVVYGLEGINGIVGAGILLEDEQEGFVRSWDMLVKIRNRIHYISRRKNDQLFFEQQEEIAEAFAYKDQGGSLGVEVFMREVYGHMQNIAVVTDLFFAHVAEVVGLAGGREKLRDKVVEKGIELRNGSVHLVASASELRKKPHLLIRVFLAAARFGVPVHHRSRKNISANLGLVTDKVRGASRATASFLAILEKGEGVADVLGVMLETGLLTAYLPEFERIVTLAQHDVYHIYTVDRHTLQAIAELRRVVDEQVAVKAMVVSDKVLYLAMLLHDIGKGAEGDHSEIGAEIARGVGHRLGWTEQECDDLRFV
ncbi:MAG: HD domain-containing protein, partial [Deltaproteobacteria bacterium]|nr:HD domain-containing protein [Deltaproteobacteria bacterium]